jgi:3-phosphoglycerate kinase
MRLEHHLSARPSKRAKKDDNAHDGLVEAIDCGNETLSALADVLREVAVAKTVKANLPDGLFEVDNLSGF